MTTVTTSSIVNTLQEQIDEIKAEKKIELEKRVKLIAMLCDKQLKAGALNLGYQRAMARMPEAAAAMVPQLNVTPLAGPEAGSTRQ